MNQVNTSDDYQAWLPELIRIARAAGDAILHVYKSEIDVQRKLDNSPLTLADIAAHNIIEAGLQQLTPHIPQLSEESVAIPYAIRQEWRRYWLIDPLDGTREFIKRNGEFSVNIALVEQGRPVIGIVYAPVADELYYACCDSGAYKQVGTAAPENIYARQWNANALVFAVSRSHGSPRLQGFLSQVAGNLSMPELISLGSSLKICRVAEGKADLFPRLGLTSEWDTAAAQCVLEEAGGRLTDLDGVPLRYNTKDSLLNPEFFACGATLHDWGQYLQQ